MLEPCDLHEVSNCSICTGADKRYVASLEEPMYDRGLPPRIPGGPTIFARHVGHCTGCGRRWEPGDAIHRDPELDGWVGVDCCVMLP
jgi:hypothetical protein